MLNNDSAFQFSSQIPCLIFLKNKMLNVDHGRFHLISELVAFYLDRAQQGLGEASNKNFINGNYPLCTVKSVAPTAAGVFHKFICI